MTAASAYDAIAGRYGGLESENRILKLMRARSIAAVLSAMPDSGRLLELGAGTGDEALEVSEVRQASVVAVEPAPSFAATIERKVRERRLPIEVVVAGAREALSGPCKTKGPFDGAWSSFALGYDVPLEQLRGPLADVLRPGAPLVVSLRNPWCLAEPWSIPARATGRYRHKVGEARVAIRHYSARAAARAMTPDFILQSAAALPAIVPPPRYGKAWTRLGAVAGAIERADEAVARRSPFVGLGDHTLMVFRRA